MNDKGRKPFTAVARNYCCVHKLSYGGISVLAEQLNIISSLDVCVSGFI